jgi:chromate reductase, NAD(P)H dehydrogenase (quinone)
MAVTPLSKNAKPGARLSELAPATLQLEIVEIGQLSLYNQDLDSAPLAEWTAFRNQVKAMDAVLFDAEGSLTNSRTREILAHS